MSLDQSRLADLRRIDERLEKRREKTEMRIDPRSGEIYGEKVALESQAHQRWAQEQAGRAKANIIAQSRDKKLNHLRQKLIRAARAGDHDAELHIEAQIRAHKKEPMDDYR